jgi:hypothetical protein
MVEHIAHPAHSGHSPLGCSGLHAASMLNGGPGALPGETRRMLNARCACFQSGARILTTRGEVAVEHLRPGDRAITLSGGHRPIRWIGWRRINLATHPTPKTVAPIRIARGALGEDTPHRDLLVSPDHAMYLKGALIPAAALVNSVNITQALTEDVTYYHVELDKHSIIFAEGAATESFLERGDNRSCFVNSTGAVLLHPAFGPREEGNRQTRGAAQAADRALAALARLGEWAHRAADHGGFRRMAGAGAWLNARAEQRLAGAAAPCATFGPLIDQTRREIARRARPVRKTSETIEKSAA